MKENVNAVSKNGNLPLIKAFITQKDINDLEKMEWLIKNGANVNATFKHLIKNRGYFDESWVETVLSAACSENNLAVMKLLVENGAIVRDRYGSSERRLVGASNRGEFEVAKFLVENGASVTNTTIGNALATPDLKMAELLIENSTSVTSEFFINSLLGNRFRSVWKAPNLEVIKFLVENGASVTNEVLEYHLDKSECLGVKRYYDLKLVKFLVENGASATSKALVNILHQTYNNKPIDLKIVKFLVENGAIITGNDGAKGHRQVNLPYLDCLQHIVYS